VDSGVVVAAVVNETNMHNRAGSSQLLSKAKRVATSIAMSGWVIHRLHYSAASTAAS
jgi:hypothetical protein